LTHPEFLHWWITARVRKREAEIYYTDQTLGIGPIRVEFKSRTVLRRPERIEVTERGAVPEIPAFLAFEPRPDGAVA
jgi:hypothetical protein